MDQNRELDGLLARMVGEFLRRNQAATTLQKIGRAHV